MFGEEIIKKENKTVLIDADSILYIAGWNDFYKCYNTDIELIKMSADKLVSNILITTKATHQLGFFSVGKSFRRELYPSYKSNRDNLKRPDHLKALREYLVKEWLFIELDYYEADDAVSICSNIIENNIITSIDKDVLMLYGAKYNYKKSLETFTSMEDAKMFFWKSMIIGDSVDGVKGLAGKGKVFAENYLKEFNKLEYSLDVFKLYLETLGEIQGIEEFYKNYKLLKILERDDKFEALYDTIIKNPFQVDYNKLVL